MFRVAGRSFAMAHATDEVKAAATEHLRADIATTWRRRRGGGRARRPARALLRSPRPDFARRSSTLPVATTAPDAATLCCVSRSTCPASVLISAIWFAAGVRTAAVSAAEGDHGAGQPGALQREIEDVLVQLAPLLLRRVRVEPLPGDGQRVLHHLERIAHCQKCLQGCLLFRVMGGSSRARRALPRASGCALLARVILSGRISLLICVDRGLGFVMPV